MFLMKSVKKQNMKKTSQPAIAAAELVISPAVHSQATQVFPVR